MTPERWAEIERLYHAALAQPPESRAGFLAKACAGDAELGREMESLLARQATDDGLLNAGAMAAAARMIASPSGAVLTGRRIGAYQIEALIGAGGMGEVYRARDTKLDRPVAIKVLSDSLADAAARRRFQREAQTASSLNHPHILTVHDVGELDGRQYREHAKVWGAISAASCPRHVGRRRRPKVELTTPHFCMLSRTTCRRL